MKSYNNLLLSTKKYIIQRDYWINSLLDLDVEQVIAPTAGVNIKNADPGENTVKTVLSKKLSAELIKLSKNSDLSLHVFLLSAFVSFLHKYTGKSDISFGTPICQVIAPRQVLNDRVILRKIIPGNITFKEVLIGMKETFINACDNQDYPFDTIIQELNYITGKSYDLLFELIFFSENIQKLDNMDTKNHNLLVSYHRRESIINFIFRFNQLFYTKEAVKRMIRYFERLLEIIVTNISIKLSDIDLLSEEEKTTILLDFNNTKVIYPRSKTIHELFEKQVVKTPDKTAAVFRTKHLTYRDLNEKSNQLAILLRAKGIKMDTVVGIMIERSLEMIIGIMGILKAGGAYLPIAPDCPGGRIKYMLNESKTNILLTQNKFMNNIDYNGEKIDLEDRETYKGENSNLPIINVSRDLAYVIYTSGSTGCPKGVMIEHRSINNLVAGLKKRIYNNYGKNLRVSLVAPYVFDASVQQIFAALLQGYSLYIVPEDTRIKAGSLIEFYRDYKIDISDGTPTHIRLLLKSNEDNIRNVYIKHFIIGGETLPLKLVEGFLNRFETNAPRITNVYGLTECCVDSTSYEILKQSISSLDNIPIGNPMPNEHIFILDKRQKPIPIGVIGEVYISGDSVARGYLNRPELTWQKFVTNPFELDKKIFRTGDLAKWLPDGNIDFSGRIDEQVKVRGFRIEPGDIENCLLKNDDIKEVVVVVKGNECGDKIICAYYVSERELPSSELRLFLLKDLPYYMIPAYFVFLAKMPLTMNGKIDKKALPDPKINAEKNYISPRDKIEKKLVEIWSGVLEVKEDKIGIDTNFWDLGAHSLKLTLLILKIQKELNIRIPFTEVLKEMTIRKLSEYIKEEERTCLAKDESLVLLKKGMVKETRLFFIHGATGEIGGYIEFCNYLHLNPEYSCWGIRADNIENATPQNLTIETVARKYLKKIKSIQANAPYYIIGGGTGATIGFEIVRQLEEKNEEVRFFAIIDAVAPQNDLRKNVSEFTLESELNWIHKYLPDEEIKEKTKDVTELKQLWPLIIKYLENTNFDVDIIKKLFPKNVSQFLPNFDQLNIRELIYYLNMNRIFAKAREFYIPSGKIKTIIHYFRANQSKGIINDNWNAYSKKLVKYYEINGDHFSILKKPNVIRFAEIFSNLVNCTE
jgi:amino acid adenylation domain-containing protein